MMPTKKSKPTSPCTSPSLEATSSQLREPIASPEGSMARTPRSLTKQSSAALMPPPPTSISPGKELSPGQLNGKSSVSDSKTSDGVDGDLASSPSKGSIPAEFPQLQSILFYNQYLIGKHSRNTATQYLLSGLFKDEREIFAKMDAYQGAGLTPVVKEFARQRNPLASEHPGVRSLEENVPLRRVIIEGREYCGRVPLSDRMRFKLPPPPLHLRPAVPMRLTQKYRLPNWAALDDKARSELTRALDAAALARQDAIDDRILDDKEDYRGTLPTDYAPTSLKSYLDEVFFYASYAAIPRPERPVISSRLLKKDAIKKRVNELTRMFEAASKDSNAHSYSASRFQEITEEEEEGVLPHTEGSETEKRTPSSPPAQRVKSHPKKRFTFLERLSAPRPGSEGRLPSLAHMTETADKDDEGQSLRAEFADNPEAEEEAQRLERLRTVPILQLWSHWASAPFVSDDDSDDGHGGNVHGENDEDRASDGVSGASNDGTEEEKEAGSDVQNNHTPTRPAGSPGDTRSRYNTLPRVTNASGLEAKSPSIKSSPKRKRGPTSAARATKRPKVMHVTGTDDGETASRVSEPKRKRPLEVDEDEESSMPRQKKTRPSPPVHLAASSNIPFGPTHRGPSPRRKPSLPSPVARLGAELAANRTPSPELPIDVNPTEVEKDLKRKRQQYMNEYLPYRIRYGPPPGTTTWDRTTFNSEFPESSIPPDEEEGVYEMGKNPGLMKIYEEIKSGRRAESTFPLEELGDVPDDEDDSLVVEPTVRATSPALSSGSVAISSESLQAMFQTALDRRRHLLEQLHQARAEVSQSWAESTLLRDEVKREFGKWTRTMKLITEVAGPAMAEKIDHVGDIWLETKGEPWKEPETDSDSEGTEKGQEE